MVLDSPYTSLNGGSSLGNGQALDANLARRAGVAVGGTGVLVQGHVFTHPGTATLNYLHVTGSDAVIGLNSYDPALPAPRTLTAMRQRGQVEISEAAVSATVTLTPAEPDVAYFVQLTPQALTTGGALGALTVYGITKAVGSFEIQVTAAPGAGKSVVYNWLVYR